MKPKPIVENTALRETIKHKKHLAHPKYRPDIDGLRCLAVLSVLFFHAFPSLFRGGFIGVDIFFVISGFLIGVIIISSAQKESFSYYDFYARRIKRIFPALLIVIVFCYTLAYFTLFPVEFATLGKHIAAGGVFISNFVLWGEAGYFDDSSALKPLLHLWSLGIEEQFYIVWPIVILVGWKHKIKFSYLILFCGILSFAVNIAIAQSHRVAAFYSPPTRFWELLIGSGLAYLDIQKPQLMRKHPQAQSALGVLLLVIALTTLSSRNTFPGWVALLPTLGTALVISAGPQAYFNRILFAHPLAVWFGLISYPLYLWHWPLLSFAHIITGETPSATTLTSIILVSILLAWLTYWVAERHIRTDRQTFAKVAFLSGFMVIATAAGAGTFLNGGFAHRAIATPEGVALSHYISRNREVAKAMQTDTSPDGCFTVTDGYQLLQQHHCSVERTPGKPAAMIIGDSHSAYLAQALKPLLLQSGYQVGQFSVASCTPFSLLDKRQRCIDINKYVFEQVKAVKPEILFIAANYAHYDTDPDYGEPRNYVDVVAERVAHFQAMGIKKIVFMSQLPIWDGLLPGILAHKFTARGRPIPQYSMEGLVTTSLDYDTALAKKIRPTGVDFISMRDLLCNTTGCMTKVGDDITADVIYFDDGHLTPSGAQYVVDHTLAKIVAADVAAWK